MINFCEDCGEKNTLVQAQLVEGKAVFKCAHCGYLNAYRMDVPKKGKLKQINSFLKALAADHKIIGAFVFHLPDNVVINHMPDTLKDSDIKVLGKLLTDSHQLFSDVYADTDQLLLQISEKTLFIRMVEAIGAIVVVTNQKRQSKKIDRLFSRFCATL